MTFEMNRREAIAFGMASLASLTIPAYAQKGMTASLVPSHDETVQRMLNAQVTDAHSRWCGAIPDQYGIHYCTEAGRLLRDGAAAYFHPESRFHKNEELLYRMKLAADFLVRSQSKDGNIDLPATNFNSPPDTGFVAHSVATAARLARMHNDETVMTLVKEFLVNAGRGLSKGGIHTPNHRWVVCEALAQINEVFPDQRYVRRIAQWLAEGIDIDEHGQYTERSTAGYNTVVDSALIVVAHKLNRPELLDPVRKNLDAMAYLLHPNGEVVTEISRRQDVNTRRTMSGYWFALRYMALKDGNGLYAAMLKPLEPDNMELARFMEYPELEKPLPAETSIPDDYEREYDGYDISRIRRGRTSITLLHHNSRWISAHRGEAVINGIRFASAFFGKGQFSPTTYEKQEDGYYFRQTLGGRYLQPLADTSLIPVTPDTWGRVVPRREMSELCEMVYEAHLRETSRGMEISISAIGTDNVPLAVEINLRTADNLSGVIPVPNTGDAFLLKEGFAEYKAGNDTIRFGPGKCEHTWTQLRGAEGKLPGPSVYLTGYTPFEHTLVFEMR